MTDFYYHIQNLLLTLHRGHGINFIKGILLQNNEVNQFRFPESHVIFYGHTVVTQDVDLLGNLLTTLQTGLDFIHLANPLTVDVLGDILFKFRVFYIFGIRVNRVYGRITLLVGTVLLKGIEAACHLLRILGYRLLQVTTGRRYRTDESNGTGLAIVQLHITRTAVEVGDDGGQVHREGIGTGQLLHTVGHLAQCLRPT